MKLGKFKYSSGECPSGYKCECGKSGVKLWREWNTFMDYQTFYCLKCINRKSKGKTYTPSPDGQSLLDSDGFRSDQAQIKGSGSICPSVPVEEGGTCWGYTSVPQDGCEWWYKLPYE